MWPWLNFWVPEMLAVVSLGDYCRWGLSGPSSPWGFCIEELGISWIFALGTLYIVNGIGVGLAEGHFVDVAVGFIIEVCMAVAVVAIASGFHGR